MGWAGLGQFFFRFKIEHTVWLNVLFLNFAGPSGHKGNGGFIFLFIYFFSIGFTW